MMRALLFCVVILLGTGSAFADAPVYWLEFYDKTFGTIHAIDKQIQQLQKKFNISPVVKVQIVDLQSVGQNMNWVPHHAQIVRGEQQDFDRYFSSADYKQLHEIRLLKVTEITMLEGTELRADGVKFLEKAPMAAIILSPDQADPSEASLTLSITDAIAPRGALSRFMKSIKQVQILPLSFDDNPMDFMPAEKSVGGLGLIGEIIR